MSPVIKRPNKLWHPRLSRLEILSGEDELDRLLIWNCYVRIELAKRC